MHGPDSGELVEATLPRVLGWRLRKKTYVREWREMVKAHQRARGRHDIAHETNMLRSWGLYRLWALDAKRWRRPPVGRAQRRIQREDYVRNMWGRA